MYELIVDCTKKCVSKCINCGTNSSCDGSIYLDLEKLKTLSLEHDSNISQENPSLTPEVLEIEKSSYLKIRKWESIALC